MQAPARAAAAADRDDHHVDLRLLLEDLERDRGHSRDQARLVPGVHVAVAVGGGETFALLPGLVEVAPVLDDLRSERPDRLDLERVRPLGDAHRRRDAEEAGGVGDRLAVVPGRGGDQSALTLVGSQLRDEVDAAAHLEGADRLVVLVLHPDLRPDERLERRIAVERRRPQIGRDALARGAHVVEGRDR